MYKKFNRILLITTWGDPYSWKPARYKVKNILKKSEHPETNQCIESTTTLLPLLDYLGDNAYALVLALDTVAFNRKVLNGFEDDEELKQSFNKYLESKKYPSYYDLVEYSRYCIKHYISNELKINIFNKIYIEILPGIGVFKGKYVEAEFSENPLSFYILSYISLLKHMYNLKPNIIVLDITHGINFMPTLISDAVISAIRTYILINNIDKVNFYMVNSDPYPRTIGGVKREDKPLLNINLIKKSSITIREAYWWLSRELIRRSPKKKPFEYINKKCLVENKVKNMYKKYKDLSRDARVLIYSYDYGLILPMLYLEKEIKEKNYKDLMENFHRDILQGVWKTFIKYKIIKKENNCYKVDYCIWFTEDIETYLYAIALVEHIEGFNPESVYLENNIFYGLKSIKEISNKVGNILARKEVHNIERYLIKNKKLINEKPMTLKELGYGIISAKRDSEDPELIKRNFLAHAGFEKSLTYVVNRNRKYYIGYTIQTLQKAKEIMKELIKDLTKKN